MAISPLRRFRAPSFTSKAVFGLPTALLLAVTLLATGCHPRVTDPKDPKFIVAEKGNWQITRADLDKEIGSYLQQHQATLDQIGQANVPKLETFMLDNMVLRKLMLEKGATMQIPDVDKQVDAQITEIKGRIPPGKDLEAELKNVGMTLDDLKARLREQVIISKVLDTEAYKDSAVSEAEVSDFYMKNKDKFNVPPQIRASRVLVLVDDKTSPADKAAKKKAIDKAHDRVAKGEEFSKVATEVSEDRYSAPRGGDLSWFKKGENEPQFDDVAFNTKTGTVSAVFETPMGFQFLKVTDSQPGGIASLADASPTISKYLTDQKKGQEQEAYTAKLLADSNVKFYLVRVDLHAPSAPAAGGPPGAPSDAQQMAPAPDAQQAPAADSQAPAQAPAPAPATPPSH